MQSIYKLTNSVNNQVYIGKTKDTKKRLRSHLSQLRQGKHYSKILQKLWNENSPNIEVTLTTVARVSKQSAFALEVHFQKSVPTELLLNERIVSSGGDNISNHPLNTEFRDLQRQLYKKNINFQNNAHIKYGKENPNYKDGKSIPGNQYCTVCGKPVSIRKDKCPTCVKVGANNPFYGKTHSEETKLRIAKAHTGTKNYRDCKPFNIEGTTYYSLLEAAQLTGIKIGTVRHRINSNNPKFSGYQYLTEEEREIYLNAKRPSK